MRSEISVRVLNDVGQCFYLLFITTIIPAPLTATEIIGFKSIMPYFVSFAILLVVSYCLLLLIQHVKIYRSHLQRAEALGCQRASTRIHKLPLGIDHVIRLIKADRRGQVPEEIAKIFEEQNSDTFGGTVMGRESFATTNPRNIQAILATQFQDFEIGPNRRLSFAPMLGVGIFTADGEKW